jgi:hypothetical protein
LVKGTTPPLFIVGAPRSGTSLLRDLVRSCDDIYLPPDETQFFPAYIDLVERHVPKKSLADFLNGTPFSSHMRRRGIWPTQSELLEILADPTPAVALSKLMQFLAGREKQASFMHWGDKTPIYFYSLDKFRHVFPNMRVLFIIRDPRDAVLSMRDAWGRSLVRSAKIWLDVAQIADDYTRMHGAEASTVIKYEALATDPAAVMDWTSEWLGVQFSSDSLVNYSNEDKWGAVREAGVVSTSVGRYREKLTSSEIEFVEGIAYDEMRRWGYEPDYAKNSKTPGRIRLLIARLIDGMRAVTRYVSERGMSEGASYKFRQFIVARRGRGK